MPTTLVMVSNSESRLPVFRLRRLFISNCGIGWRVVLGRPLCSTGLRQFAEIEVSLTRQWQLAGQAAASTGNPPRVCISSMAIVADEQQQTGPLFLRVGDSLDDLEVSPLAAAQCGAGYFAGLFTFVDDHPILAAFDQCVLQIG